VPLVTLVTPRLILRPPARTDAAAIFEGYATDPEVSRFVHWSPHKSIRDTLTFLEQFIEGGRGPSEYPWVITLAERGAVIGAIQLRVTPPRAEFGYNLSAEYWNRGLGTEAARAVVGYACDLGGIERVQAFCHVDNQASRRVLEKAGLRQEARLRRYMLFPNLEPRAQDVCLFAVTTDEWHASA
jgi:ribosomal-protein-alanine N-acetyltransferase